MRFWDAVDFWLAKTAVEAGLVVLVFVVIFAGLWAIRSRRNP
jgi:hypothetical protein